MAVKRFGANHVLGIAMIAWSIITLATGFIQNYSQAIAVRVLLGTFEAGLVPSVVFIISTIWERERQSKRVAIIYGCNCLSGAFGGLIAVSRSLVLSFNILTRVVWNREHGHKTWTRVLPMAFYSRRSHLHCFVLHLLGAATEECRDGMVLEC
jgi:MFS family permease